MILQILGGGGMCPPAPPPPPPRRRPWNGEREAEIYACMGSGDNRGSQLTSLKSTAVNSDWLMTQGTGYEDLFQSLIFESQATSGKACEVCRI